MDEFSEYYKTVESLRIVSILRNQSDYNLESIKAAKLELESRNLSDNELQEINSVLDGRRENETEIKTRNKAIKESIQKKIETSLEIANPKESSSNNLKIKSFSALLVANGLLVIYSQWSYLNFVFTDEMSNGVGSFELLIFVSIIVPIISGVLLWRKTKIGYYLAFGIAIFVLLLYGAMTIFEIMNNEVDLGSKILSIIFQLTIISISVYGIRFLLKDEIKEIYFGSSAI